MRGRHPLYRARPRSPSEGEGPQFEQGREVHAVAVTALSAVWILVDMERDQVLNRMQSTTPGRVDINWEFLKRLAVF